MSERKTGFLPLAAPDARVLVLGSLPGESSLAAGQYYGHPRNLFWRLMSGVIGTDLVALDYENRLAMLQKNRIALWDTVASAERRGSLDTAIRNHRPEALAPFVATLPELRAVGFNGRKSASIGRPQLGGSGLALIDLPSSSPAYAAMPFATKQRHWAQLKDFLP